MQSNISGSCSSKLKVESPSPSYSVLLVPRSSITQFVFRGTMEACPPTVNSFSQPGNLARSAPECPTKRLHFDLMKNDENENIARYLSAHPNLRSWPRYICENVVATFYEVDGEFGRFICSRLLSTGSRENTRILPELRVKSRIL